MKLLAALRVLCWLPGVLGVGVSTHLRSRLLSQAVNPGNDDLNVPHRFSSLESAVVDSTQILSPAELEEAEETSQELPQSVGDDGSAFAFGEQSAEKFAPATKVPLPPFKEALRNFSAGRLKPPAIPPATIDETLLTAPSAPKKKVSSVRAGNSTAAASTHLASMKNELDLDGNPPSQKQTWICNPPCLVNRGICNNGICFCKSPYAGTTCQHEVDDNTHISIVIFVFFIIFMSFMGLLTSHIVFAQVRDTSEQRMALIGGETVKQETWTPNSGGKKKKPVG
jgi:hypothetical protein